MLINWNSHICENGINKYAKFKKNYENNYEIFLIILGENDICEILYSK